MGIKGLTKLIAEYAPAALKENKLESYFARRVCVDASMAIYSFLVAVRSAEAAGMAAQVLTNEAGETTSHIQGLLHRTIRMLESGIKPCFVFDGKPPELKSSELAARAEKRAAAEAAAAEAQERGDTEEVDKFNKRNVKVTKDMIEDAKKLLRLMGVPIIEAPSEAEAQCAAMARAGKVFAVGSEDMDSLTFGSPILLRHLTDSKAAQKLPVLEINLETALTDMGITMDQFIDICILCGCDYAGTIKGVGPKTAVQGIIKHKTMEAFIESLDKEKHPLPDIFPYEAIRNFFKQPEVIDPEQIDLQWTDPNEEELIKFLVTEKGFDETRVKKQIERLKKTKSAGSQQRLDSFFTMSTVKRAAPTPAAGAAKKGKPGPAAAKGGAGRGKKK